MCPACGKEGTVQQLMGHKRVAAMRHDTACAQARYQVVTAPSDALEEFDRMTKVASATNARDPDLGADPEATEPPEEEEEDPEDPEPERKSSGRLNSADKGTESLTLNEPAPKSAALGQPTMIRSWMSIPIEVHALFQAAKDSAELQLDPSTTLSQFVSECTLEFFRQTLRMEVRLVALRGQPELQMVRAG